MNGRVFPSIQEAIYHTAHSSGVDMKVIAAELDYSPSNLSSRATITENPTAPFPASKLIHLQKITNDHSVVATMAEALGYELHTKADRMPELVQALTAEARRLTDSIQLVLATPWVTQQPATKRSR